MEKRKVGRPAKEPEDLITYKEAVEVIKEELRRRYKSELIVEQCSYSIGTLYNKASAGLIHRWRKGRYKLLSRAEVLKLVG